MLKALIIEDDKFLAASLKAAISEKFDADVCYDGLDGIKLVDENVLLLIAFYQVKVE